MDAHAAQLRHQIDATRTAMDATLTQLERQVLGPGRGVQETVARVPTLLRVARLGCRGTQGALDWPGWCAVRGQHPNGSGLMRA
jgi:hypothetical protein